MGNPRRCKLFFLTFLLSIVSSETNLPIDTHRNEHNASTPQRTNLPFLSSIYPRTMDFRKWEHKPRPRKISRFFFARLKKLYWPGVCISFLLSNSLITQSNPTQHNLSIRSIKLHRRSIPSFDPQPRADNPHPPSYSLAKAEIHLALAVVISRFDIRLYDTHFERDVRVKRDYFLPQPGVDSRGVRVLLR